MKTTSIAAAFLLSAWVVIAQGTVTFVNNLPGQVVAPIYGPEAGNSSVQKSGNTAAGFPVGTQVYTGSPLSGAGWSAQLLGAPGSQPESSLVALSAVTPFGSGGFIVPLTFASPFPGGTTTATYQMVAWDNQGGAVTSWAAASALWQSGQLAAGKSPLYAGGVTGNTTFLRSFNLSVVPEPSSLVFLVAAAAGGVFARRRRNTVA